MFLSDVPVKGFQVVSDKSSTATHLVPIDVSSISVAAADLVNYDALWNVLERKLHQHPLQLHLQSIKTGSSNLTREGFSVRKDDSLFSYPLSVVAWTTS